MTTLPAQAMSLASGQFWQVEGDAVNVFLAPPVGTRDRLHPLVSLVPGALVGGLPQTQAGRAQVALPALGASMQPIGLHEMALLPDAAGAVIPWLNGLLATGHDDAPPRDFVPLSAGGVVTLAEGAALRPLDDLAVIVVRSGLVTLRGNGTSPLVPGEAVLVRRDDWVVAVTGADVEARALQAVLRTPGGWEQLATMAARAFVDAEQRVLVARGKEESRLQRRHGVDDRGAELPDRVLASLLNDRGDLDDTTAFQPDGDDAVYAAAALVARAVGVDLERPAPNSGSSRVTALEAIAQASRVRVRAVRLEGTWWKTGPEPMIGELVDGARPVALLPRRGGVDLIDPSDGSVVRLSPAHARTLVQRAHVFYRGLPERSLAVKDLAGFAAKGAGSSLAKILLTGIGVALIGLLVPVVTGTILGTLVPRGEYTLIVDLCLILLAAAVASGLLSVSQNLVLLRLQGHLDSLLQSAVWDRLISLPGAFFRGRTVGALATSILSVSAVREILAASGVQTVFAFIVGLANIGLIYFYSVPLGLLTLVVVVIAIAIAAVANSTQVRRQRTAFAASQRLNAQTYELVRGLAKLRAAAAEDRAFAHWAPAFAAHRQATFRARVVQNGLTVFNATLTLGGTIALFLFASRVVEIEITAFLIVYTAFAQVLGAVVVVSNTVATVVMVVPYLESLSPVLETEPEVSSSKLDAGELVGDIELNQVTFRYTPEGPPALLDVSFQVAPGEFIAIVGPSGSGKSTLLRLLLGFEQPESGAVLYDGRDLASLDVSTVRRQCGVVLQDGALFAGDLASNIGGSGAFSHEEILAAANLAGLGEDIAAMPLGLSTIVSEGAATLSGGQRQRLMIARALISRPRILFFDEATSALDNRTQEIVTQSTRTLNATRIVIAHRLSTVMDADRIVVVDGGRVVQIGSYAELCAQEGTFRTLAARQQA
ncbi:NHLP bacteriocin export ABC transporter permease/ATPase subunit [Cryobacterium aureum]|uniref:NHLP bacteriocin export ABC transporter permease/ATPase subunit n=1 Tax=Cryobacterium aureum TaxID=995037 RepID=UPI000CF3F367|nr:NHLP bacteriocin export ABC transporter permease/ATPase subunit [Cryobacterium aureum]